MAAIPEVQFRSFARDFIRISSLLKDDWELNTFKDSIYLRKQQLIQRKKCEVQGELSKEGACVDEITFEDTLENDSACLDPTVIDETNVVRFDYHVLYSESYGVPVLYFNVYRKDGGLIGLDEVWNLVPPIYQERLKEERWTFITQQEHPYLGRPFYQLHPCHTANLMGQVTGIDQSEERNYLVSWLSAVGPVVHLSLPLEYGLQNSSR